ncbi:MAG: diguanylate cyclase, partial [Pseudomonadota bacterium]|nr:diguanylate cyclase [Pseudomonadota bacterium]
MSALLTKEMGVAGAGMRFYRRHFFVLGILAAVSLTGMHNALQNSLTDMRFSWFPRQASGHIVLVAIDSPSIEKVGVWPWPRQLHAELIGKLEEAGAADIVFDVDFSSPSNPASDQSFLDALQKAGGSVVLPSFKQAIVDRRKGGTFHVNRPLPQFGKSAWSAVVNVAIEPDGLVRRYPYGEIIDGKFLPSVGALLSGKYETKEESLPIDFSIRADSVPVVSYVDVLRGDPAAAKMLKDKKVIIGGIAIELGDRFNIPNGQIIPGSLLQVLAAESILQNRVLRHSSYLVTLGGFGIIALLMVLVRRRLVAGVMVLVGFAFSAELIAVLLQAKLTFILDTSLFQIAIAAYFVAIALEEINFRGWLNTIADKRFHRIAMSLGDGLVCADRNGLITVWNPGAAAIFGYAPKEIIGQPLTKICAERGSSGNDPSFSLCELPQGALQLPGGKVTELEGRRKDGETFPLEACFSGWQGPDGFQYGAVLRDISVRKREEEKIRYLAECDTLTGLANRNTLHEYLCARLAEAKTKQCQVALLVMDLDKFKQINDTLGHAYGDQVLCAVAKQLTKLVRTTDLVARLSGDEFAVVISGIDAAENAEKLADRTALAFSEVPLFIDGRQHRVNISVGVAIYPKDCGTADELLGNADLALY